MERLSCKMPKCLACKQHNSKENQTDLPVCSYPLESAYYSILYAAADSMVFSSTAIKWKTYPPPHLTHVFSMSINEKETNCVSN